MQQKVVGTTALQFRVAEPGYVLVYNSHATAIVTVYPGVKAQDGITVGPGTKRSLPHLPGDSLIWIVSDTASTTVQVWHSPTKWGFDWIGDELITAIAGISPAQDVTGDIVAEDGDVAQTGSATVTFDLTAGSLLGYGSGFSFLADADVEVVIYLVGSTATPPDMFIVAANTPFTFPPGPKTVQIDHVEITDRSGAAWHIDFIGY